MIFGVEDTRQGAFVIFDELLENVMRCASSHIQLAEEVIRFMRLDTEARLKAPGVVPSQKGSV